MSDYEQRKELSRKHIASPKVGDYWHEMFSPYFVVVGVFPRHVEVVSARKDVGNNKWTWDLEKPTEMLTREQFKKKLTYGGEGRLKNEPVGLCSPEHHKWVAEELAA